MYVLLLNIAFYGLFIGGGVGVIGVPISRKKGVGEVGRAACDRVRRTGAR